MICQGSKRIILFMFLLVLFLSVSIVAAHTVKTPRNSTVSHSHPSDTGWWGYQYGVFDYYTQSEWTTFSDGY